ncbi:PAS domain-containing protein [Octadecabacter ascidiaceicola]|nr:PAS domain-containing protein [Octadecabacter ascidiaceicola]
MTNPTALKELEKYWATLPRSNGVPHRKHVDPIAMGSLLEDSFILERVAPGVARIRVAGRNITKLIGLEPRGLPLTAVMLPEARADIAKYLEQAFMTPSIVEFPLVGPRAVGQPKLHGKILLLPLRDDHGRVSRILGVLVMSGRRGLGGRRFSICPDTAVRVDAVVGLHVVAAGKAETQSPTFRVPFHEKAEDKPALRLVVSND